MITDTSEKGLETLILRHMTGTDGLSPAVFACLPAPHPNPLPEGEGPRKSGLHAANNKKDTHVYYHAMKTGAVCATI